MTEKEIMMARQAGRICRNLQAENARLREQLMGDPEQERQDAEAFAMVRRQRKAETQARVYNARPVFDFDNADVMESGSIVFVDDEIVDEPERRTDGHGLVFAGLVVISTCIWAARHLNWVDTTTAIAVTVVCGLMASFFGMI